MKELKEHFIVTPAAILWVIDSHHWKYLFFNVRNAFVLAFMKSSISSLLAFKSFAHEWKQCNLTKYLMITWSRFIWEYSQTHTCTHIHIYNYECIKIYILSSERIASFHWSNESFRQIRWWTPVEQQRSKKCFDVLGKSLLFWQFRLLRNIIYRPANLELSKTWRFLKFCSKNLEIWEKT